jgi:cell division protease FtsH
VLERCARELLSRETLDEQDIRRLTADLKRAGLPSGGNNLGMGATP